MAATSAQGQSAGANALGLTPGTLVQELGWAEDVDEDLRDAAMDAIDADLIYDAAESVDVVLLWWRDSDGDLTDGLVDALTDLNSAGYVWLLTPKVGRPGYVDPTDIAEAALTAGLSVTRPANASAQWQAQKLVRPKSARR